MPMIRSRRRLAAAFVLLGATGAALAAPATGRPEAAKGPIQCELEVSRRAGSVELTALAHADKATRGQYRFRVSGQGTDIRQGGPFAVPAGRTEQLGTVTLGANAANANAELEIVVGSTTIRCAERLGARI